MLAAEAESGPAPRVAPPSDVQATALDLRSLFQARYASVHRLLRRCGVEQAQLDDAAQEVFWVAARRLQDIHRGREHAFLYGVALRVASQLRRKGRAAPSTVSLDALFDVADAASCPEQGLVRRRERDLLDAVLDGLPLELRTVLVLFELEELPIKEIAQIERIPVGTASSRLRRAREQFAAGAKRLRAQLLARGDEP